MHKKNNKVLSPNGVALWLLSNTSLTFKQIADFCGLYETEVLAMSDGLVGANMIPVDPVQNGDLTLEEINSCEKNTNSSLKNCFDLLDKISYKKQKKKSYTPMFQRQERPEAILWLLSFAPELSDTQIIKILKTTKNMIEQIRNKTFKDFNLLIAKDPVSIGFITQKELNHEREVAVKKQHHKNG